MRFRCAVVSAAVSIALHASPAATVGAQQPGTTSDSAAVVAVVDAYHRALASGDSMAVEMLLAPDAIILESGHVETRAQYLGGHLRGDIAFARAVPRERSDIRVVVQGDAAWATSTSITKGEYRERPVNSAGAELMVLRRTPQGWRIAAIHWSARNLRP
jgi:ketosteroid isomerase-like protein